MLVNEDLPINEADHDASPASSDISDLTGSVTSTGSVALSHLTAQTQHEAQYTALDSITYLSLLI